MNFVFFGVNRVAKGSNKILKTGFPEGEEDD